MKADLPAPFVCRLLNHLRRTGVRQCMLRADDPSMAVEPWVEFSSGYFQRALDQLPGRAKKLRKLNQDYLADLMTLHFGAVGGGVLRLSA